MTVRPDKQKALKKRMQTLGIKEEDLIEKFIIGSGKGGQKKQKTHSCVYIKHRPTEIEIKCDKMRERETNRYVARCLLCDTIEEKTSPQKSKKAKVIEKIRKQKKRRSRRTKEKLDTS